MRASRRTQREFGRHLSRYVKYILSISFVFLFRTCKQNPNAKPFKNKGWPYYNDVFKIMPVKAKGGHVFRPAHGGHDGTNSEAEIAEDDGEEEEEEEEEDDDDDEDEDEDEDEEEVDELDGSDDIEALAEEDEAESSEDSKDDEESEPEARVTGSRSRSAMVSLFLFHFISCIQCCAGHSGVLSKASIPGYSQYPEQKATAGTRHQCHARCRDTAPQPQWYTW